MKQNRKGFTLLEIIIVIVIIGVLAALALTRLTPLIETSKGSEAVNAFTMVRGALERCNSENGGTYLGCGFLTMDVQDPGVAAGAHFTYGLTLGATTYRITATRTSRDDPGTFAGRTIWIDNDGALISIGGDDPQATNPYRKFFKTGN